MADVLDANGLQIKTYEESLADMQNALIAILGSDVNFDSNTPDGQLTNTIALEATDLRNLLKNIYNNFDPDLAQGIVLDQRVAINNIQRQAGTFTLQDVLVTVDRSLTLQGLDTNIALLEGTGFTISDSAGNQFILANSIALTAGAHTLSFRAKNIGVITTTPNTITVLVSVILGVVSVNNPTGAQEIGTNEEVDSALRIRRNRSVANNAQGYIDGIYGNISNVPNVTDAKVFENITNVTDVNGIPAHGIWVIAQGGADKDIATKIYTLKSAGSNMKGDVVYSITNKQGFIVAIKFSRPLTENLYIKFDLKPTISGKVFNLEGIKNYVVKNLNYTIGQDSETSKITTTIVNGINSLGGGGVPLNVEISKDNITYVDYLTVTNLNNIFTTANSLIFITEIV